MPVTESGVTPVGVFVSGLPVLLDRMDEFPMTRRWAKTHLL